MDRSDIPLLAEILETYFEFDEFGELASSFDVVIQWTGNRNWITPARQLVERLEYGNHRVFVTQLLEQADIRNSRSIANTDWERRAFHYSFAPRISNLRGKLRAGGIPAELAIPDDKPFTAKAEVREFLDRAETPVLVVDPYVGLGTLDCFRSLRVPVRLLTGTHGASIEDGFDRTVQAFRGEGFQIEIRRHPKLHDRHIIFNERCWLVGSSLKDAGKKAFHAIEILDAKDEVVDALEAKWQEATPYP